MNKSEIYQKLHLHRFELFFISQIIILFGSLVVPLAFYQEVLSPVLFLVNILCGSLLISHSKRLFKLFIALFVISVLSSGYNLLELVNDSKEVEYIRLIVYFLFYVVVTLQIIRQVWNAKNVNKNVVMGLMSGYISIGLVGFFIFFSIELANPGSFSGILMETENIQSKIDSLLYYSYITLLTIGYGEIYPITPVAQKSAILVGLMGQFYLVIITAVVVEKYIRHSHKS